MDFSTTILPLFFLNLSRKIILQIIYIGLLSVLMVRLGLANEFHSSMYSEEKGFMLNRQSLFGNSQGRETDEVVDYVEELGTIVVSAKRGPSQKKQSAENVIVYTKEDIARLPGRDLTEVLGSMAGVDVQLNGQFGQASNLSINGSPSRQVLLMVDGIPFNNQLSGQANPTQIPIENIERIELIKGASSSVWGSSLGGVINVLTKDTGNSEIPEGTWSSSFAEFKTTHNSLDLAGRVFDLGYYVSGSFFDTDGLSRAKDTSIMKGFSKVSYSIGDTARLTGSFGYTGADARYGIITGNSIIAQPYIARYGKLSLDGETSENNWNVAYKYNDQYLVTDTINASSGATTFSTVSQNFYQGLSLNHSLELSNDRLLIMGGDFDWHELKSNKYLRSAKSINMQAPYMNFTFPWWEWEFIPGLRYDHNQQFGSQLSPSWGMVYHFYDPSESLLRAKVSRAFNAPPLLWLYNHDPSLFVGPNPDLKAERAFLYELGAETKFSQQLSVDLNLYRADVNDGIALVFDSPLAAFVQRNFRKFVRQGGELLLKYTPINALTLYGSGGFNDVINTSTKQIVRDQGIARQKFTFGAAYKTQDGLGIHLSGYYNRWSSPPSQQPNDRKPIFNLKLTKSFESSIKSVEVETFLTIHNLTNSNYWSSITYPLAERYFEGGFQVKF